MVTERLTTGLSLETGDRFIVLYGVNTSDTFSSSDLLLQDIEQALHSYFLRPQLPTDCVLLWG
jgi:hypothetical protein